MLPTLKLKPACVNPQCPLQGIAMKLSATLAELHRTTGSYVRCSRCKEILLNTGVKFDLSIRRY